MRGRPIWLGVATIIASIGHAGETATYTYDALGRLIEAKHTGTVNNDLDQKYTIDAVDNRIKVKFMGSPFSNSTRVIVVPLGGLFVIPIGGGTNSDNASDYPLPRGVGAAMEGI